MWRCELCEHVKMYSRPPLLEKPFAQTLSGKTINFTKPKSMFGPQNLVCQLTKAQQNLRAGRHSGQMPTLHAWSKFWTIPWSWIHWKRTTMIITLLCLRHDSWCLRLFLPKEKCKTSVLTHPHMRIGQNMVTCGHPTATGNPSIGYSTSLVMVPRIWPKDSMAHP